MAGLQRILHLVQPELAAVHELNKCRHCETLLDVVQDICDDLRAEGAADSPVLSGWLAEGNAYRHASLGCEVCIAMEPYNRWGYLKQQAQAERLVAAGAAPGAALGTVPTEQPVIPPLLYHPDPAGYFRLTVVQTEQKLVAEHYTSEGRCDAVIDGATAEDVVNTIIERGLVSRLDHAAYLGRELAKAETALRQGNPYQQDA